MESSQGIPDMVFQKQSYAIVATWTFVMLCLQAVQAEDIVISSARIQLLKECRVSAADAGQLTVFDVQEGSTVQAGQVIAELENRSQKLALEQAQLKVRIAEMMSASDLNLKAAIAKVDEAEASRVARQIALEVAEKQAENRTAIGIAEAESKLRELEIERAKKAKSTYQGSVSGAQLDRLRTDLERWKLEIERANNEQAVRSLQPQAEKAAVVQVEKEIARTRVAVDLERQNRDVARVNQQIGKSELQLAEWNLELRNIRSPISGVVSSVEHQKGEWVEKGAVVLRIINLDRLRIEGLLPAKFANRNLVGQQVQAVVQGQRILGEVVYVGREIDPVDQVVSIYAEFDNPDQKILPGTICDMTITSSPR